jgi:hypothetical protein
MTQTSNPNLDAARDLPALTRNRHHRAPGLPLRRSSSRATRLRTQLLLAECGYEIQTTPGWTVEQASLWLRPTLPIG